MSERSFDPNEAAAALLAHLRRLKEDRGAMANLRGALKPSLRHRAWPLLGQFNRLAIGERRYETVAGLFAHNPEHDPSVGNLGDTCRQLSKEHSTFDGRFRRMLACDREEICDHIRPVVLAKGARVNYEQLFCDLWYWSDSVKVKWARAFWGAETAEATP